MLLCMKNPFVLVCAKKQTTAGALKTLEGQANYQAGDFIVTGIANEQWVVKPDENDENVPKGYTLFSYIENAFYPSGTIFKEYEFANVEGIIRPVWDPTGETKLKYVVSDALITHGKNDIGPCNRAIFDKTYVVGNSKEEILEKLQALTELGIQQLNEKITIEGNPNNEKSINLEFTLERIEVVKNKINNRLQEIIKTKSNNQNPSDVGHVRKSNELKVTTI